MVNMELFANKLINAIKTNDKFVLFVHIHPDFDAMGSALALMLFIKNNFKNKDVRIAGLNKLDCTYLSNFFVRKYKEVSEDFAKKSVGIVLDTANYERIYQKNLFVCKETYRIDHHIFVEKICDNEFINPSAASTCEMIGLLLKRFGLKITDETANSLYFGILTDTIRFLTNNVNKNTYDVMSFLIENTNIDRMMVHNQLYLHSLSDQKLDVKLIRKIKIQDKFAWLIFNNRLTKKYGHNKLKTKIYLMANIKEIEIYALLYYDEISKFYRCSLRSRRFDVNAIAKKFGGGGHKYASGCRINNIKEFKELKKQIIETISNDNAQ